PEPGAQSLGRGQRRPHRAGRAGQCHGALDAVRERHHFLLDGQVRTGDGPATGRPPWRSGSGLLLGGAAGEVAWAAVGGAGTALGELPQAGSDEVVPAAAAHVLALELVVEAEVLEGELAGTVVEGRDREGGLCTDPVLHEGALGHRPADGGRAGRLADGDQTR